MTATVHVLPGPASTPPLLPERRKLLLDWLAVQVTCSYSFVPEDVQDALLDMCACPDLSPEQRADFWDDLQNHVDLREGLESGRYLPDTVGCTHRDDAEETAGRNAQDALSLLVFGNQAARGSHTPRGNAS